MTHKENHPSHQSFQEFSKFVPGSASFFKVILKFFGQNSQNKFLAFLELNDGEKLQSDLFVLDSDKESHLLSFKLPYRVAPLVFQTIPLTEEDDGPNYVSFRQEDYSGILTWDKGSFKITMEFGEFRNEKIMLPSVKVTCTSRLGRNTIKTSRLDISHFCELYQALDAKLIHFAQKNHPQTETLSCSNAKAIDLSIPPKDVVRYVFSGTKKRII